jgi:hypothetical protein
MNNNMALNRVLRIVLSPFPLSWVGSLTEEQVPGRIVSAALAGRPSVEARRLQSAGET